MKAASMAERRRAAAALAGDEMLPVREYADAEAEKATNAHVERIDGMVRGRIGDQQAQHVEAERYRFLDDLISPRSLKTHFFTVLAAGHPAGCSGP